MLLGGEKKKLQSGSMLDKWRRNEPNKSRCHLNFMFQLVDTKLIDIWNEFKILVLTVIQHAIYQTWTGQLDVT